MAGCRENHQGIALNLSGANSIMKPLMAAAMKVAGKGKKSDGKKKAEVKMKVKASAKVKSG